MSYLKALLLIVFNKTGLLHVSQLHDTPHGVAAVLTMKDQVFLLEVTPIKSIKIVLDTKTPDSFNEFMKMNGEG